MLQSLPGQTILLASAFKSVRLAATQITSLNGVSQCVQSQNSPTEIHPLIAASRGAPPSQPIMLTIGPEPASPSALDIPTVHQSPECVRFPKIVLLIFSQTTSPNVVFLNVPPLKQHMHKILLSVVFVVALPVPLRIIQHINVLQSVPPLPLISDINRDAWLPVREIPMQTLHLACAYQAITVQMPHGETLQVRLVWQLALTTFTLINATQPSFVCSSALRVSMQMT
jgi:hypothetical protein